MPEKDTNLQDTSALSEETRDASASGADEVDIDQMLAELDDKDGYGEQTHARNDAGNRAAADELSDDGLDEVDKRLARLIEKAVGVYLGPVRKEIDELKGNVSKTGHTVEQTRYEIAHETQFQNAKRALPEIEGNEAVQTLFAGHLSKIKNTKFPSRKIPEGKLPQIYKIAVELTKRDLGKLRGAAGNGGTQTGTEATYPTRTRGFSGGGGDTSVERDENSVAFVTKIAQEAAQADPRRKAEPF